MLDARELVRRVIGLVAREAELARVDLRLEATPDLPKILAARDPLQQVMLNLVLNALGASPSGGARAAPAWHPAR
jgi:signal transduction histidine kinase